MKVKKYLFLLICLLITNNVNSSIIVERGDSLTLQFILPDSMGSGVDDATGDSVFVLFTSPSGEEIFSDSMLFSDGRIKEHLWEDVGNNYSFTDIVSDIDGSSATVGSYGYVIKVHDQSLGLQFDFLGNFQIVSNGFDETLELTRDSLIEIIDSIYTASAQRGEILDSTNVLLDSVIAILDSVQLYLDATISSRSILTSLDNIGINWADVINQSTVVNLSATTTNLVNTATDVTNGVIVTTNNDKGNYTLSVQGIEDVVHGVWGHIVDTGWTPGTFGDSAKLWGATAASGGVSDAEMAAIADSVWQKAVRSITDKLGFALTDAQLGSIADSVWQRAVRELTALDEDNTTIDLDGTTIGNVITLTTNLDKINYTLTTTEHGIIGDSAWNKNVEIGFADPSAGFLLRILGRDLSNSVNDTSLFLQLKTIINVIESQRGKHSSQAMSKIFYVDPVNGDTHANGNRGGVNDPYNSVQDCHDNAVTDSNHDIIFLVAGAALSPTTLLEDVTLSKRYTFVRGPGRDFIWSRTGNGNTINLTGDGIEVSGFQLGTDITGVGHGVQITDADFTSVNRLWINDTQGDGINILRGDNTQIYDNHFFETGQSGAGQGVHIIGTAGTSNNNSIYNNDFRDCAGDAVLVENGTTNNTTIKNNSFEGSIGYGVNIGGSSIDAFVADNRFGNNTSGPINDGGVTSVLINNEQWSIYDHIIDSVLLSKEALDSIWYYNLTGTLPNQSAGKALRDLATTVTRVALSRGMAGTSSNIVLLDLGASTIAGSYDPSQIENVATGETGYIIEYDEINQAAVLFRDLKTPFNNGDEFKISSWGGFTVTNDGRVRGSTSNTMILNPLASSVDSVYDNQTVLVSAGDGSDEAHKIKSYNSTTREITLYDAWHDPPDDSSSYVILPFGDGFETRFMDSLINNPIPVVAADTNILGQLLGLMPGYWTAADSAAFQGAASGLTLNEIALIVDSILSANHGLGSWITGGAGSGPNTLFIYTIDSSAVPDDTLTGVPVYVNNLSGSLQASGITNSLGYTTVGLTFDTWRILAGTNMTNYSFDDTIFTNSNNPDTFSIFGYLNIIPSPADPSKGLLFGYAKDVLGNAKAGVIVKLALETTMNVTSTSPGGYVVGDGIAYDTTDAFGYFGFEVPRSSTFSDTLKSLYNIQGDLNKVPQFVVPNINIPDVGNVDITDEINN